MSISPGISKIFTNFLLLSGLGGSDCTFNIYWVSFIEVCLYFKSIDFSNIEKISKICQPRMYKCMSNVLITSRINRGGNVLGRLSVRQSACALEADRTGAWSLGCPRLHFHQMTELPIWSSIGQMGSQNCSRTMWSPCKWTALSFGEGVIWDTLMIIVWVWGLAGGPTGGCFRDLTFMVIVWIKKKTLIRVPIRRAENWLKRAPLTHVCMFYLISTYG